MEDVIEKIRDASDKIILLENSLKLCQVEVHSAETAIASLETEIKLLRENLRSEQARADDFQGKYFDLYARMKSIAGGFAETMADHRIRNSEVSEYAPKGKEERKLDHLVEGVEAAMLETKTHPASSLAVVRQIRERNNTGA